MEDEEIGSTITTFFTILSIALPSRTQTKLGKHCSIHYSSLNSSSSVVLGTFQFIHRYITEKLLNAFLAGCLPIYSGTREVFNVFSEDAFVFYDMSQPQLALDKITFLEEHPAAYIDMLRAPILANGGTTIDDFFSIYPNIGKGSLNRKIRQMMGLKQLYN
jgi:hypothetical protein